MSSVNTTDRSTANSSRYSPSPSRDPDAGLRAVHHYERRLPRWRYRLRQRLIPVVRRETPYLARMQKACRSPLLDSYFASTANLGTHTFFMMSLPICYWFGHPNFGLALVHMLCLGVYLTGVLKDLVCLPRPLSPPLQRITMSGSTALEYGFPSTHTTNAVSVGLYLLYHLYLSRHEWSQTSYILLCLGCLCYATSITLGRMYCGMHGFFDVVVGAALGALITLFRVVFGPTYDLWNIADGWFRPGLAVVLLGFAVRFHPEPADDCPCFDDSVAFLGVIMGIETGTWHRAQSETFQKSEGLSISDLYAFQQQHLVKMIARLVGGVIMIFAWRAVMKPFLLKTLPAVFRFVDHWGLMIPRRYFLQASDYGQVPPLRKDDNVLPSASDIPSMLFSFRTPRRRRVSVGPQSEADAREYLANRVHKRRDGRLASSSRRKQTRQFQPTGGLGADVPSPASEDSVEDPSSAIAGNRREVSDSSLQVNWRNLLTPPASDAGASSDSGREDEKNDRKMFSSLEKPRTHYDVEVITKLVVYAGIGWLAVEGNPMLFELFGLD